MVYILDVIIYNSECVCCFVVEVVVLVFKIYKENRIIVFVEEFNVYIGLCISFFDIFSICNDCICVLIVL